MAEDKRYTVAEWCDTQKWLTKDGKAPADWYKWASTGTHIEDYDVRDGNMKYIGVSNVGWKRTDAEWDDSVMDWMLD